MRQLAATREQNTAKLPAKVEPLKVSRNFDLRTDLQSAYEQVAAAYGLKASFDPDLPVRDVRLQLDNVDFESAMKALAAETGTFWHALNSKLIFISADTAEKRKAYDPQVEQTFVLPASTDPTEMTEMLRVVREMTGAQHIQQSVPSHSITIRDSVERVELAGAIIHELEQARGEVLLEIDLLEVDRSTAKKLGITPPGSLHVYSLASSLINQLRSTTDLTTLLTLLEKVFGVSALTSIPPFTVIGGGGTVFLLTFPGSSANFSETLTFAQSGRQVLLRAQTGKAATFFVGDHYPITLSLLSSGSGSSSNSGSSSSTISTEQFTVGAGPVAMVTADFRTIGLQDLAVLNELDNTITILLNQGSGASSQFAEATGSPISLGTPRTSAPTIPAAVATGDLNPLATRNNPISGGDNLPDLLVTDPVANNVTVLLQTSSANGTFLKPQAPILVGHQPSAIAAGMFNTNNDSNVGFVVTNFTDNTYSVFDGNGDGTFTEAKGSPFALPAGAQGPYAITIADFNGDGKPDLAIVNRTSNSVTILEGAGDGTFQEFPNSPLSAGKSPVAIASGSLSGSTGPSLAVVNQDDNTVSVFVGNGDGTFIAASQSPLATGTTPTGVAIADFLQQSDGGIAVSNAGSGTVTIFVDLGSGLFTTGLTPAGNSNPGAIVAADFTNSTFPDIVVANNNNDPSVAGQVTLLVSPANSISNPSNPGNNLNTGSQYEDIGVKVKATPDLNDNDEVTLQMEFEVRALAGTKVNGLPVITNRTLSQAVRLKENETSLIGGLTDKQETKTITGLPGLAEIPGLGYTFGVRNNSSSDTDFLILVTPRVVRLPQHDSRTIYAGRGDTNGRGTTGANAPLGRNPSETQPQVPTQMPVTTPQPMPAPDRPIQRTPHPPADPPKARPEPQPQQPPL